MRALLLLAAATLAVGQTADPAYAPLSRAYDALKVRDYDRAVAGFLAAIDAAPARPNIRKDLAYTYLKVGENELARDQFREAMRLEPEDTQVALEYAFLCNETKEQAQARVIFDRIRKTGNAVAEQAFQNIDQPLAAGIERWKKAIAMRSDNFSVHFELATLAERRGEMDLAAEHFEKAWKLLPDQRSVLVDLGRVWKAMGRAEDANAALLAASRGGEPRAAEMAHELLPDRYPYVPEFRRALELDPKNAELRRELGYLLLRMEQRPEAEIEFRALTEVAPEDLLAATQLGFLLYGRGERASAQPLFDRVLAGNDEDLANRVRAVLRMPQVLKPRPNDPQPASLDAKVMAERSIKAGYLKDALKYLQVAHEADPGDFDIMLKLGWTFNILHQDREAFRWFDLARRSSDPQIAAEAARAWQNLRGAHARFRTTGWIYPTYSTRWNDLFSYAQIKTELNTGTPVKVYLSGRFVGDTRRTIGAGVPQYLSESAFIAAVGVAYETRYGIRAWMEAGSAIGYLKGHALPDYRGGISIAGRYSRFAETTIDAVYISRFDKDVLLYDQTRIGKVSGTFQAYWNAAATMDVKGEYWANFIETGPGIRITLMPSSYFTVNVMRGAYLVNEGNPRGPNFFDVRAGFWYAFTR